LALDPILKSKGGLILSKDMDKDVKSEGVAKVVAATPKRKDDGSLTDAVLSPGDFIVYRGFLRFANQIGDLFGKDKNSQVFLLNLDDVLAVVEGEGSIGLYDEFEIGGSNV